MGGLACCGNSYDRKDDTITFNVPKPVTNSPGKLKEDGEALWEIVPEVMTPFEKD